MGELGLFRHESAFGGVDRPVRGGEEASSCWEEGEPSDLIPAIPLPGGGGGVAAHERCGPLDKVMR